MLINIKQGVLIAQYAFPHPTRLQLDKSKLHYTFQRLHKSCWLLKGNYLEISHEWQFRLSKLLQVFLDVFQPRAMHKNYFNLAMKWH